MDNGLSNLFDTYSLYAKAFPGIIFILLFISLLPSDGISITSAQTGAVVVITILLVLVLGFVLGQAVHAVSVFIESQVYILSRNYYIVLVSLIPDSTQEKEVHHDENDDKEETTSTELTRFGKLRLLTSGIILITMIVISGNLYVFAGMALGFAMSIFTSIVEPGRKLRNWVRYVLTPHRTQFHQYLSNKSKVDDEFTQKVSDNLGWAGDVDEELYRSVISYLEFNSAGRARTFQAIYSFCRSMWVMLSIFSAIFLWKGLEISPPDQIPAPIRSNIVGFSEYPTILGTITGGNMGMLLIGGGMLFLSMIFFHSEGNYKRLFIEYTITDYLVLSSMDK